MKKVSRAKYFVVLWPAENWGTYHFKILDLSLKKVACWGFIIFQDIEKTIAHASLASEVIDVAQKKGTLRTALNTVKGTG